MTILDLLQRLSFLAIFIPCLGLFGLALIIAILTVSYQAFKAALADPVKALRYE